MVCTLYVTRAFSCSIIHAFTCIAEQVQRVVHHPWSRTSHSADSKIERLLITSWVDISIRSATKVMREQLSATYAVEPPGRWIRNKLKAPLLQGRHREPAQAISPCVA